MNTMERSGILAGGNWIVDHIKIIDRFPPQDSLANILHETTGLALTDSGEIQFEAAREAACRLIDLGVREGVFLHFPDGVIAMNRDGDSVMHGSVQMPASAIVGTGGAGDALAAGILTGLHEGWDVAACLELGVCCAATSLREANCSGGVTPWQDALQFGRERGYHAIER